ncbi:hypothetical protein FC66_GL001111 [Dellaglioa algida DSM 15638]|uniref:Uncharacterized protein n=1 Tax=Dellaglioa algida DSM 15638 TaxID=1423719 RepID=A0A0R1HIG6_9LACO|nr:hypothetical protein FC66_GL001111 [Dellaglioa algida DSM 15638]
MRALIKRKGMVLMDIKNTPNTPTVITISATVSTKLLEIPARAPIKEMRNALNKNPLSNRRGSI